MCTTTRPFPSSAATPSRKSLSAGFTAIELLVVIAIAAILVSIALPSFKGVITRYQVQRATEDLIATIYFARSEAMKRGGNVTLRKNPAAVGCDGSTKQDWDCGWFVFFDANADGVFNTTTDPATNDVVLRRAGIAKAVDVTASRDMEHLSYDRWGRAANLGVGPFGIKLQPHNYPSGTVKRICFSSGGRLRTETDPTGTNCAS